MEQVPSCGIVTSWALYTAHYCEYFQPNALNLHSNMKQISQAVQYARLYIYQAVQYPRLYQGLMSHPKGGEGAFNYVVTALSKVLAVL